MGLTICTTLIRKGLYMWGIKIKWGQIMKKSKNKGIKVEGIFLVSLLQNSLSFFHKFIYNLSQLVVVKKKKKKKRR